MALRISGFVLGLLLIYVGVESRLTLTPPRLEEDVSDSDTDSDSDSDSDSDYDYEKWNEEQEEIFYKKTDLLEKIENSMIPDESVEYRKHDIGPTVRACFFGNQKCLWECSIDVDVVVEIYWNATGWHWLDRDRAKCYYKCNDPDPWNDPDPRNCNATDYVDDQIVYLSEKFPEYFPFASAPYIKYSKEVDKIEENLEALDPEEQKKVEEAEMEFWELPDSCKKDCFSRNPPCMEKCFIVIDDLGPGEEEGEEETEEKAWLEAEKKQCFKECDPSYSPCFGNCLKEKSNIDELNAKYPGVINKWVLDVIGSLDAFFQSSPHNVEKNEAKRMYSQNE